MSRKRAAQKWAKTVQFIGHRILIRFVTSRPSKAGFQRTIAAKNETRGTTRPGKPGRVQGTNRPALIVNQVKTQ